MTTYEFQGRKDVFRARRYQALALPAGVNMRFVKKVRAMNTVVVAKLSAILYHKTTESAAIKILKENQIRLSTWLGGQSDKPKDGKEHHVWYLSTSHRPGAYKKDSSGVVIVLDGAKLDQKYEGEPFDYWGEEWRDAAKKNGNANDYDEAEERVFSDHPTIKPASDYIKEIHTDWYMNDGPYAAHAYKRHRQLTLFAKRLGIPIYWYEDQKSLDTLPKDKAKKFSDFAAGPSMTETDLQDEHRFSGKGSAYSVSRWKALLSIEPAKSMKDVPKNVRKYLSDYSDGHSTFEADIHNASKNMKEDELRFIYKLQTQMKRAGVKTVKEFYWKMMDKLRQLEKKAR